MISSYDQGNDIMYVWAHYENRQEKISEVILRSQKTGISLVFITRYMLLWVYNTWQLFAEFKQNISQNVPMHHMCGIHFQ